MVLSRSIGWLTALFCLSHRSATAFVLLTAKLFHNLVDLLRKCRSRTDGRHLRCGVKAVSRKWWKFEDGVISG